MQVLILCYRDININCPRDKKADRKKHKGNLFEIIHDLNNTNPVPI